MEIIGELNTKGNISRDKVKQGNQILNTMLNYTLIFFFFLKVNSTCLKHS